MTHPRDHVLCLSATLQATMTDVTKVSLKVRVNGGAATTYTSVSNPAVAQAPDVTYGYHLELPANSFADGDRVSRTWIFNGTPVPGCYGNTIIGPASVDGAHFTPARGDKLDDLDAAVSTRATPADVDVQIEADLATLEANVAGIKSKTDLLGTGTATFISAAYLNGDTITIVQGDDYSNADGTAIVLTVDGAPDLTTYTSLNFTVAGRQAGVVTALSATTVCIELTAAETNKMPYGQSSLWSLGGIKAGKSQTIARGPAAIGAR
jgi:hypothetical protein